MHKRMVYGKLPAGPAGSFSVHVGSGEQGEWQKGESEKRKNPAWKGGEGSVSKKGRKKVRKRVDKRGRI